jgi:hypothetical protein
MLIVDTSAVKYPGEAKQNNLPPEYGQLIDGGENLVTGSNQGFWGKMGKTKTGKSFFLCHINSPTVTG